MKILQTTIERLLYLIVLFTFIGMGFIGITQYNLNRELKQQQMQFHDSSSLNLKLIEQNQVAESLAVKTYIACLLTLNAQSTISVQVQETICFNQAPAVKK